MSVKLMMGVLRELENESSTNAKEQLIKAAGDKIPSFKSMLQYALNPYKKFNIQVIPPYDMNATPKPEPQWGEIALMLDDIVSRKYTGTALKTLISGFMAGRPGFSNHLLQRILLKDLRCGVGATLVNNVYEKLVPQFGIMLANPLVEHHVKKIQKRGKAWWQAKKNGHRLALMIPPRHGKYKAESRAYSRKGHEVHNYQMVLRNLEFVVDQSDQYRNTGIVFDGEVINKDFFTTSEAKKLPGNEVKDAVLHCFDMVSLPMWEERESLPFSKRRVELAKLANGSAWQMFQNLTRVPSYPVDMNLAVDLAYYDELRDRQVKAGEEGLILRLDDPYNWDSRASMFKHKKMDNMDCQIMEILPGEEGKKYEHTAGRVLVRLDDGETLCYAGIKPGPGQDLKVRAELWKNRHILAGQMCEVTYQEKTVSKSGAPKLQFPVFQGVREDLS